MTPLKSPQGDNLKCFTCHIERSRNISLIKISEILHYVQNDKYHL